ncbi:GGDEF domain-containing protein [Jutongia sp.]
MEKESKGFFNPTIKEFWNCLYQESADLKQCEKHIADAIALVADEFGVLKVEMDLNIPPNRYQIHGEQRSVMLTDREGFGESTDFSFAFATGGNVVFHVVWNTEQSNHGRDELEILLREVFFWYDRNVRQTFLQQILNTDMETGAANPYAFTGFAGMLMARGILNRYCVVFFNIHNFKYVNKVFTYAEGDLILRQYTSQVKSLLQEEEKLARLGGDNFVALFRTENTDAFIRGLQEMKVSFSNELKSKTFVLGATIGVSRLEKVPAVREVMSRASIAYQEARRCGVGGVVWYSDQIYQAMMERQNVISNFASIME